MDLSGWRSLCRLSSSLAGDADTLPFEHLSQETAGLICLTGGTGSTLNSLIRHAAKHKSAQNWLGMLAELFPGAVYVELNHHTPEDEELNTSLAALAHRSHLPVVAAHKVHYLTPDQWELQRVVTAIRLNRPCRDS